MTNQALVASVCGRDYKVVATSEWLTMDIVENTFGAVRVERDDRAGYNYHDFSEPEDEMAWVEDLPEFLAQ